MKRNASAIWQGDGMTGQGALTTQSGVFKDQPYSFKTRFQNEDGKLGTNPEELIAAAHAGCFNMSLSFMLAGAGFTATRLDTTAEVSIDKVGERFAITGIVLKLRASVPGIDATRFAQLADAAKANCPVSKALAAVPIALDAALV